MIFTTRILTPPAIEPVTLAELKEHCRVTEDLDGLAWALRAARAQAESFTGKAFISQSVETAFDMCWGETIIALPRPPIISVDSVFYFTTADTQTAFSSSNYVLDGPGGRVFLKSGASWPSDVRSFRSFVWTYTAGYGATAASVPPQICHAIKLLAAHLYEHREAASREAEEAGLKEIPFGVKDMLYPFKEVAV